MGYISNFKKFMKSEEKKTSDAGANPQTIEEQGVQSTPSPTPTVDPNDPGVKSAQDALNKIESQIGSLTSQIGQLQQQKATAMAALNTANAAAAQKAAQKVAAAANV